jgi:hypothetical protein
MWTKRMGDVVNVKGSVGERGDVDAGEKYGRRSRRVGGRERTASCRCSGVEERDARRILTTNAETASPDGEYRDGDGRAGGRSTRIETVGRATMRPVLSGCKKRSRLTRRTNTHSSPSGAERKEEEKRDKNKEKRGHLYVRVGNVLGTVRVGKATRLRPGRPSYAVGMVVSV